MKYFRLKAAKEIIDELVGDSLIEASVCSTEYINNYCNKDFVPTLESSQFDKQVNTLKKQLKTK